ncbi:MAG: hypothetical protein ABSG65_04075 [Bryobacteraceae bacterium]
MRNLLFCLIAIGLCATNRAAAQCSSAPTAYTATCANMQGYIGAYNTTLGSQWKGSKAPTAFGTELLYANDNIGLTGILSADAMTRVNMELDGLAKVGVQMVTTAVSFPILYQPFYTSTACASPCAADDYATVLTFYQNVVAAAHQRGMKVLIEAFIVFPDYVADLGLPGLSTYFAGLSEAQLTAGRAQQALIVAQQIKPDWINLGSEPDTLSELMGLTAEYTAQQWATDIGTIVTQLRSAGIKGTPLIGAGCGAWQQNGSDYVQALMSSGIDYFDMHTFSVNMDYLTAGASYIDMALAAGKGAAISEAWDHKLTDTQLQGQTEYGIINLLSGAEPYNAYSFWAPQDAQFLQELIDLAYWKQLYYVSPFESELFFANLDYTQYSSLSASDLTSQETTAEGAALAAGTLTPLGKWYGAAIKAANASTVSSAGGIAPVAPASLVSIYGSNLAAAPLSATSLPLPTNLGGISAVVTDSTGAETSLPLLFVSPSQVNAVIPAGANTGPAVITINTPSGAVASPVVLNPTAPTLFTANLSGGGVAAGQLVTNKSSGQVTVDIFTCAAGSCSGVPLDVSGGNTALVLYGTGIQNRASLSDVTVTIGAQTLTPFFAGASAYTGEDQVDVSLPASLAGSGTVNITVTVAGTASNVVTATFQ